MLPDNRYLIAFESSCDDTAVAIIDNKGNILADVVQSQVAPHAQFGGVVPEIASRHHLIQISQLTKEAFRVAKLSSADIGAVAATLGPGLIGSLLVGAQFAKGMAQSLEVPFIGVHHIEGHVLSSSNLPGFPKPPFIALIASGGHSALYCIQDPFKIACIGETLDDAAGEAFDKVARQLRLPYPGGKIIDELAEKGNPVRFKLPIALKSRASYDYSFSGLKTAARQLISGLQKEEVTIEGQVLYDLCASVRFAVVQALLNKAFLACKNLGVANLVLGGGVCANSLLRRESVEEGKKQNINVFLPPVHLCTDNAVMIALAALRRLQAEEVSSIQQSVSANLSLSSAINFPHI